MEVLAAIAAAGADVQYILTGTRSGQVAEGSPGYAALSKREGALLDNYRHAPDGEGKRAIEQVALMAARAADEKEPNTPWDGIDRRKA